MRVLDPDRALLHAQDAIGGVAELEHIALQALDGEVFVDRADGLRLRLEQHRVVGRVGYRAAGGERRQTRAAPAAHFAVDGVVVDEGAAPAASRGEPVGEHADDFIELSALQVAVGVGAVAAARKAHRRPTRARRLRPRSAAPARRAAWRECAGGRAPRAATQSSSAAHSMRSSRDSGKSRPFGRAPQRVPGASDALQQGRDGARRSELTDQVHFTDVDAELERCGRDEGLELAALEARLRSETQLLCQAAVVRRDQRLTHTLG